MIKKLWLKKILPANVYCWSSFGTLGPHIVVTYSPVQRSPKVTVTGRRVLCLTLFYTIVFSDESPSRVNQLDSTLFFPQDQSRAYVLPRITAGSVDVDDVCCWRCCFKKRTGIRVLENEQVSSTKPESVFIPLSGR